MPKKKSKKKSKAVDSFDDSASVHSDASNESLEGSVDEGALERLSIDDSLLDSIEQLTEKRASTRESALDNICRCLSNRVCDEVLESRVETLQMYLVQCIKRGRPKEVVLACSALDLFLITIGGQQDAMYQELLPVLEKITAHGPSVEAQAAAASTLAVACFVCSQEREDQLKCMELFADLFMLRHQVVPEPVQIAALKGWGLLASTLSDGYLAKDGFKEYLPLFRQKLNSESLGIRSEAGENIALLFDSKWAVNSDWRDQLQSQDTKDEEEEEVQDEEPDDDDDDDDDDNQAKRYFNADVVEHDFGELVDQLQSYATDSQRFLSKKDRKAQRSTFRDILGTITTGEVPEERLVIGTEMVVFDSWARLKQLNCLREALMGGVLVHFLGNRLIRHIFDLSPEVSLAAVGDRERLSAVEKRMYLSPNSAISKNRTTARKNDRNRRNANKHRFVESEA